LNKIIFDKNVFKKSHMIFTGLAIIQSNWQMEELPGRRHFLRLQHIIEPIGRNTSLPISYYLLINGWFEL
jgi:hypothetical protein